MKPRIGSLADFDNRHYTFVRQSGLSPSDFRSGFRVPWLHIAILATAFVIGGMAFLLL